MRGRNHACEKERVEQVLEISQRSVAAHWPGLELVHPHVKAPRDSLLSVQARAENVHLMTAPNKFLNQINRFGRTSAAGRKKRFVGQESEFHPQFFRKQFRRTG